VEQGTQGGSLRDQSTGDLVKALSEQTSVLVRKEVDLAKAELAQKGKQAGIGAGMFGAGGLLAIFGLAVLTTALIAGLSEGMDTWLAALIVGVLYLAGAGVAALMGRERIREATPLTPEQAVETTKEDVQWAKTQIRSETR
jgi:hypothetical protein